VEQLLGKNIYDTNTTMKDVLGVARVYTVQLSAPNVDNKCPEQHPDVKSGQNTFKSLPF
jgi:hypothetical protein